MAIQHDWKIRQISTIYDEFDIRHYVIQYKIETFAPETLPHMMTQNFECEVMFNPHNTSDENIINEIKNSLDVQAIELFGVKNLNELIIPVVEVD